MMLIKIKSLFPVKFKTFLKKFRKFNGYNDLDKQMLKLINFKNGFFIDIGANDGVNQSTTWYYEKTLNWNGVLIEPLPHIYKELKKNRSNKNFFFNVAAVSKNYKKENIKIIYDKDSLTAKTDNSYINCENKKSINVQALTIKNILNRVISKDRVIDFFSLDVEGAEFEVLDGIDFNENKIKYFLIETSNFEKLRLFLERKEFKFIDRLSNYNLKNLPDYGDYLFKSVAQEARQSLFKRLKVSQFQIILF